MADLLSVCWNMSPDMRAKSCVIVTSHLWISLAVDSEVTIIAWVLAWLNCRLHMILCYFILHTCNMGHTYTGPPGVRVHTYRSRIMEASGHWCSRWLQAARGCTTIASIATNNDINNASSRFSNCNDNDGFLMAIQGTR
jgi:hypothetical protein